MALLGDEMAAGPETTYFTRAITINAPADQVWPWLVEILRSLLHGTKIYPRSRLRSRVSLES